MAFDSALIGAVSTYGAWLVGSAIAGDNAGFWIGRTLGIRWVTRHQAKLRLNPRRLKLGQYLFLRHGGKVVFFGRFVAVLRAFAAFFAGLNNMDGRRFLLFNALGAIAWAGVYGIGAYLFGEKLTAALNEAGVVLAIGGGIVAIAAFLIVRRYERAWEDKAERALPGPLGTPSGSLQGYLPR